MRISDWSSDVCSSDLVRAVDDYTVEYELTQPYSELLYQMTQHFHTIINIDQVKELGDDFGVKGLDGTGPFCFQSWEPRNELILTTHEGYNWGPEFYAKDRKRKRLNSSHLCATSMQSYVRTQKQKGIAYNQ